MLTDEQKDRLIEIAEETRPADIYIKKAQKGHINTENKILKYLENHEEIYKKDPNRQPNRKINCCPDRTWHCQLWWCGLCDIHCTCYDI